MAGREERPGTVERTSSPRCRPACEHARELESLKIRELREALVTAGYRHLTAQARALGLSRSTTWSILHANHKNGVSGAVIKRMLDQPELPSLVRAEILEYVDEKSAGTYRHSEPQLRRFAASLTRELRSRPLAHTPEDARDNNE